MDNNCHQNPPPFTLSLNTGWLSSYFSSKATNNWYGVDDVRLSLVSACVCRGLQSSAWSARAQLQLVLSLHQLSAFLPKCATARLRSVPYPEDGTSATVSFTSGLPPSGLPPCLPLCRSSKTSWLPQTAQWLSGWAVCGSHVAPGGLQREDRSERPRQDTVMVMQRTKTHLSLAVFT